MSVVNFPTRFSLLGDNQRYASVMLDGLADWVGCHLESRDSERTVFQAGSSTHPEISSAVTLRNLHVTRARAEVGLFHALFLSIRPRETSEENERDYYFELVLHDDEDVSSSGGGGGGRRATLRAHKTYPNSTQIDESFSFTRVRYVSPLFTNNQLLNSKSTTALLQLPASATEDLKNINIGDWLAKNTHLETGLLVSPTIFTVYEWAASSRTWTELVYDLDKATVEDSEIISTVATRIDNSSYDQPTTSRPTLTYSETIETSFSRSFSWGLEQRIQVTGKIPFVGETQVEFKGTQTWENNEGNSTSTSIESSVQLEVIVPPFRKTVIYVVGRKGKLTIPFRYVETSIYEDGTTMQRTLDDGVCNGVSSVDMLWRVEYYDATTDSRIDEKSTSSGYFPSLS